MASKTIADIVEEIRHAIFGKDVRENIALGIQKCYTDVSSGVTTANTAANNANSKATAAQTAATNANNAASAAQAAASNVESRVVAAQTAAQNAEDAAEETERIAQGLNTAISENTRRINNNATGINKLNANFVKSDSDFKEHTKEFQEHTKEFEYYRDKFLMLDEANLVDNNGNTLADITGQLLAGQLYYIKVDETGTQYHIPMDASMVGKTFQMGYNKLDIPIVYLNHPSIPSLNKKADGTISGVSFVCSDFGELGMEATLKEFSVNEATQGYSKKSYDIVFDDAVILKDGWGAHEKYVLQAEWVDFSHIRNTICANIWGQIRKTRINPTRGQVVDESGNHLVDESGNILCGENDASLGIGLNNGAIDAFSVCVVINGTYWGIYSLSIPKDAWMADMNGENEQESIVSAQDHGNPSRFKELVNYPDATGSMTGQTNNEKGFLVEYIPDEDDSDWVADSLNRLISAAVQSRSSDQAYINAISPYLDIDSAIDYYIFNCIVDNGDAMDKRFLLDTWDGTKWYFAAYGMDSTFGNEVDGKSYRSPVSGVTFAEFSNVNRIMNIIYEHDRTALINRYRELRRGVLSESNLMNLAMNYSVKIPKAAVNNETLCWPERPGTNTNDHNQIINYFMLRCKFLDSEIDALQSA